MSTFLIVRFCPKGAGKWPRDINTEMVTKVPPVTAVNLSIGAFCIEFRCEYVCDDEVSGIGVEKWRLHKVFAPKFGAEWSG